MDVRIEPLRLPHDALRATLQRATRAAGRTGEAARQVALLAEGHFQREERLLLPLLALLPGLARGEGAARLAGAPLLAEALRQHVDEMKKSPVRWPTTTSRPTAHRSPGPRPTPQPNSPPTDIFGIMKYSTPTNPRIQKTKVAPLLRSSSLAEPPSKPGIGGEETFPAPLPKSSEGPGKTGAAVFVLSALP